MRGEKWRLVQKSECSRRRLASPSWHRHALSTILSCRTCVSSFRPAASRKRQRAGINRGLIALIRITVVPCDFSFAAVQKEYSDDRFCIRSGDMNINFSLSSFAILIAACDATTVRQKNVNEFLTLQCNSRKYRRNSSHPCIYDNE